MKDHKLSQQEVEELLEAAFESTEEAVRKQVYVSTEDLFNKMIWG